MRRARIVRIECSRTGLHYLGSEFIKDALEMLASYRMGTDVFFTVSGEPSFEVEEEKG